MSNQIDAVKQFQTEIAKITNEMKLLHSEVLSVSKATREAADSLKGMKSPKGVNDAIKKANTEAEKLAKATEKQRLAEIKLAKAREKAFDNYEKQVEKQKKAREQQVEKESQLRQRLQKQREKEAKAEEALLNKMIKDEDLAIKKKLANLRKEENERAKQVENRSKLNQSLSAQRKKEEEEKAKATANSIKRLEKERKAREKQINDVSAFNERLQKQREAEAKAIIKATQLSEKLGRALNIATKKRNELAHVIQDLNVKRELGNKLSDKEQKELAQSTKEFQKYDTAIRNAKESVGRFQENVGNYPKTLGGSVRVVKDLAGAMGLMGGALAAIGIAKDAFTRIKDFDKSMQNLSGVMRVGRKDIKDLEDTIISVAGKSVRTSNEIANLAESLTTLGKSKEDVKALLQPVTDLSLGLNASADEAGEFLVQMLNSFGATTAEAGKYADTIATIRTSTSLDFQKMRDSFQYIAPVAKVLNKDLAQVGAEVGILADNGLKAESSGRLLASSYQKLAKDGMKMSEALKIINDAKAKGVKEDDLLAISTELFGIQSGKVGLILADNTKIIDVNAQAIRDNTGALDDLVSEQLKSLDSSLKILSSRWEEYLLKQNDATGGSNKLSKAINFLSENLEVILSTTITVVKWLGIYKAITIAASVATGLATAANTAYRIGLVAMRGGISKVILSMRALKIATAASGIGLFLVALGAAYEIFQTFKDGAKDATDEMKNLNKEMDNFQKVSGNYKKIANSYEKGIEQIGKAIEGQSGIIDRVASKLKEYSENEYQFNAIHILEAEKLIMETKEKDIDAIKKRINEAGATFSERQKTYILNEISGYQALNDVIKENEEFLDKKNEKDNKLKAKSNAERKKSIAISQELTDKEIENAEGITDAQKKQYIALQKLRKLANEPFDENGQILDPEQIQADVDKIVGDLKRIEDARKQLIADEVFKEALVDLSDTFDQFTDVSGAKLLRFFDALDTNGKASLEELGEIASASFSLIGDVSNSFFQEKINKYDEDIEASNSYYDNLLANEENSEELNKRLTKDKESAELKIKEKQKKEREKQFLADKAFAIAEIAVNTAVAVSKAAGQTGIFGLAASIPLIALGAVQTGIVLAQKMPKFAEGGTMQHDGAMMINDHSSGRLEVVERDGQLLMTDKRNAIVEGKKGDIIHKDAQAYFKNLSDDDILNDAKNHSMIATINHQNNIANKLNSKKAKDVQKIQTDRIVNAILSKKTTFNVHNNVSLSDDLRYAEAANEH